LRNEHKQLTIDYVLVLCHLVLVAGVIK